MRLHVITACSRPGGLPALAASLAAAAGLDVTWHVRFDLAGAHPGGQAPKNVLIDGVADGWIWIGDDDNTLHPAVGDVVAPLAHDPAVALIVVSQELPDGTVRRAAPGCLAVNQVDAAQIFIRRVALGALRLPETYAGDGLLAEALAAALPPDAIRYCETPAAYYNRQRWER